MDSFCKMMVEDNHSTAKLRIPPDFVNNYGNIFTQSSKTMTLRIDDEPGKLWKVRIQQRGDFHFFTKGWPKFAEEVGLQLRDFMTFKLLDESSFHVSVFDTTCCNKDCLSSDDYDDDDDDDDEVKDGETSSKAGKKWEFSKEVKKHHLDTHRMEMPKGFVVGTGIKNKGEIILEDGKGRKWAVKVTGRNKGTFGMTAGWKSFAVANGAKIGSFVSYEFVSGNLVRALVTNTI